MGNPCEDYTFEHLAKIICDPKHPERGSAMAELICRAKLIGNLNWQFDRALELINNNGSRNQH
jgi:hypothetical protein